jgi:hypothetical protein
MRVGRRLGTGTTLFLLMFVALIASFANSADASPGALQILILESQCESAKPAATLRTQVLALPGVAAVDFLNGKEVAPTVAQLAPYDVVVVTGDCKWLDATVTGNSLADYQDQGGVVVGTTFNWQESEREWDLAGRWITAGYSPYQGGAERRFATATLGTVTATSPLLGGVTTLSAFYRDNVALAPGATEIAKWSDGTSAIATKGNALGVNAYLGDDYNVPFSGDFAKLIVNAGNVLGRHLLTVSRSGNGLGAVTSSPAGIACSIATCTAPFTNGSTVTLSAAGINGAKFTGWSGAGCTGTSTCLVPMLAAQSVSANFEACLVPKLVGKTLKRARKVLRTAHCALGKVTPKRTKDGKVRKQWPKAGVVRPFGASVKVKLEVEEESSPKGKAHH